jgi:type I restriction enzyme S subunit
LKPFPSVPLLDICYPKQWRTLSSEELTPSGYPVYGANGQIGYYSEYTHEESTLMITCRGATCGTINLSAPFSYIGGNAMALDRLDPRRVDRGYLYHCLQYRGFRDAITGAAQPQITRQNLARVEIPLPSLDKQRRIAAILDKADAPRLKRKHSLKLLDSLIQSMFWDMFGDPVSNPRGWAKPRLDGVCARLTVGIVVRPASYYTSSGAIALRSVNIRENAFDLEDIVCVSPEDNVGALAKSRIFKDDVVIVRTGQPGKAAVVPAELDNSNAIDILIVTPNKLSLNPQYLCDLLNSNAGKALVLEQKRGQIQQHLNLGSLKAAELPIPPITMQNEYVERSNRLRSIRHCAHLHMTALTDLYSSLKKRAFSGQL